MKTGNRLGRILLLAGAVMLAAGVVAAFTSDSGASQILLPSSILLNSLGITMMRGGSGKGK